MMFWICSPCQTATMVDIGKYEISVGFMAVKKSTQIGSRDRLDKLEVVIVEENPDEIADKLMDICIINQKQVNVLNENMGELGMDV